ncbi:MAG: LysR family transcriptional regulator [Eubacterium sp.]
MELRQLRYFLVIAEEGSISAAARRLHLSQPPLSRQMSLLEAECEMTLFHRGRREITLTEAGRVLQRYASQMLETEDSIKDEMNDLKKGRRGVVRIGLISSAAGDAVCRMLSCARREIPDLQLRIYEGNSYEVLDMLESEKIDLAVVRTPFAEPHLQKFLLRRDCLAAVGRPELFPDAAGTKTIRVKVADLAARPLILYRRWEKIFRMQCEQEGIVPRIFCINDDARTALQMAKSGLGAALVPQSALSDADGLLCGILEEDVFQSDVYLVSREDRDLSETADAVRKIMASSADR